VEKTMGNTAIIKGVNLIKKITRHLDVITCSHILQESTATSVTT